MFVICSKDMAKCIIKISFFLVSLSQENKNYAMKSSSQFED